MKRVFAWLTALTLLLGCVGTSAFTAAEETDAFAYVLLEDGTAEITGYTGERTDVTVPGMLDGHPVSAIGYQAFAYNMALMSVDIPAGVTQIGDDAFFGCTVLKRVSIPAGTASVGEYAFASCDALTGVELPESVVSVGARAFDRCQSLLAVSIPAENAAIGSRAFAGCAGGMTVFVPAGSATAQACQAQGVSVVEAEDASAAMRTYVDRLLATPTPVPTATPTPEPTPTPVTYKEERNVRLRVEDVSLSDGVSRTETKMITYLVDTFADGTCAVKGCLSDVKDLVIPETINGYRVTVIKGFGFNDLHSITIPDSVTTIDDRAALMNGGVVLMDWSKLTVYASAGSEAERYCREHDIAFGMLPDGMTPVECGLKWSVYTYDLYPDDTCVITGYEGDAKELAIPEELNGYRVTSIGENAFWSCSSLTSVTIPHGVTSIGRSTFEDCNSLTSISIPDSVTSIGDWAFENCSSLTSITIPDSVTVIGYGAFGGCPELILTPVERGLKWSVYTYDLYPDATCVITGYEGDAKELAIPEELNGYRVTSIGQDAFRNCDSLTSVTIPDGVTSIGNGAFYGCKALTSITIPEGVTIIGDSAFWNCSSLTSITIPNGVTSIGASAFQECRSLTSISIPESVTIIGDRAFYGCSALTSITIPDGVTIIRDRAFLYCRALTSVTIPDSVTSIEHWAFNDCSALTSVTIPDSVTSIDISVFENCPHITLYIHNNAYAIQYARERNIPFGVQLDGMAPVERGLKWSVYTYDLYPDDTCVITGYRGAFEQLEIPGAIQKHPVAGLGPGAFAGKGMTSVVLPDSVRFVAADAFEGCEKLRQVKVASTNPVFMSVNGVLCRKDDGQQVLQGTNAAPAQPAGGSAVTGRPMAAPTQKPTAAPTQKPTATPTQKPTATPGTQQGSGTGEKVEGSEGGFSATATPTAAPTPTPQPAATERMVTAE